MSGKRALIYARIRENQLDPKESDITRGERQQAVVSAMADKIVSFTEYLKAPFNGDDITKPLATDLSAAQILQLSWIKFRTPSNGKLKVPPGRPRLEHRRDRLHRRHRGERLGDRDGDREERAAASEAASGPYGPGCIVGG
jgi:hypothetical protein